MGVSGYGKMLEVTTEIGVNSSRLKKKNRLEIRDGKLELKITGWVQDPCWIYKRISLGCNRQTVNPRRERWKMRLNKRATS